MLPSAARYDKAVPPPYLVEIGRFIRDTRFEDLPPAVVDRCKRLIADCFAVITAGNQSEELRTLAASYLKDTRPGTSWVIGTPYRAARARRLFSTASRAPGTISMRAAPSRIRTQEARRSRRRSRSRRSSACSGATSCWRW